jgi:hypothetical protein
LAPGIYYDSIIITAINAINSPLVVQVVLTILPTDTAPEIVVDFVDTLIFAAQEERGGHDYFVEVNNKNPGCMDWELQESISWVDYTIDSSNNKTYPWEVMFNPNGFGLLMGTYIDSGFIVSTTASNSPRKLDFKLYVWKLHGDVDYNGVINILDISYFIRYLYLSGPEPMPELIVADCNCDFRINLIDITAIIDYLYRGAGPLCGNPY